jgi:HK97 family phage major capsid protein
MDPTIQKYEAQKETLHAELHAMIGGETVDEAKVSAIKDQFDAADAAIEARKKVLATAEQLGARIVRPQSKVTETPVPQFGQSSISGGDYSGARPNNFGFRSVGEFAKVVHQAARSPHRSPDQIDQRLGKLYAASLSTYGSEGVGADGGYAVPPEMRADIIKKLEAEDSLIKFARQINTSSNSVTLPIDETTPWGSTGVQVYWAAESVAATQSKPALQNTTIRAEKLLALVAVTDELLADAPALSSWLMGKAPDVIVSKVNDAILNGTGAGQPAGIISAGGTVSQAAEAAQTAATVNFSNVTKMWSRMRDSQRRKAIWIANQDIEPQLYSMTVAGSSASFPAFLPPGGLSGAQYATLFGRPIIYTEATKAIGTVGDIVLADMDTYLAVVKDGGVRSDMSIHLWFDQDTTAFRWVLRIGGQGLWKSTVTRPGSKPAYGSFVTLAAR